MRRAPQIHLYGAIALGGAAGALARAALAQAWVPPAGTWPWATFAANVAGSLVLGAVTALTLERHRSTTLLHPLVGTGFCGALTTFSTLNVEAIRLVRAHASGTAAAYLAASLACGLAAALAGQRLARVAVSR